MFSQNKGAVAHGLRLQPLLIAAILTASVALATPGGGGHQLLPPGNHKLCGPALSDAMDVVCPHGFNTLPRKRESLLSNNNDANMEMEVEMEDDGMWQTLDGAGYSFSPLLTHLYGSEVLIKTRRHRRHLTGGVYDECCVKSCSYEELATYCLAK
ncbi:probable insulin-like peptide 1 [Drosophila teissieri]|uniref:probable insulin-like peptide 1 n=1 Tax=Drosophila teissieri TaxID=7243 RepID=UPI001CBA4931|nr:probable insulin-like peptide 1 [Drosophila teissieri]